MNTLLLHVARIDQWILRLMLEALEAISNKPRLIVRFALATNDVKRVDPREEEDA